MIGERCFTYAIIFLAAIFLRAGAIPYSRSYRLKRSDAIIERPGSSNENHDCGRISPVPEILRSRVHMFPSGLDKFYQKYTEAYGIPILGSKNVSDSALKRACYLVRFLLADRPDVRESFYKMFGRVALMAHDEMTTDIPEHSHMEPIYWNARARGLGGSRRLPLSTGGEENALCLKKDRYPHEDIVLHELIHSIHGIGANFAIQGFNDRVTAAYKHAKETGLWTNTYAMQNHLEYFAEAAQSYFNDNDMALPANGIHNGIYNRSLLKDYDPDVYSLFEELWPCKNQFYPRCLSSRELEQQQTLKLNCGGVQNNYFSYDKGCEDKHFSCRDWASSGECDKNPGYMKTQCLSSCRICTTSYRMGKANSGVQSRFTPLTTCSNIASDCKEESCTEAPRIFSKVCRDTCVNCRTYLGLPPPCIDKNIYCPWWAKSGECQSNPRYMVPNCRKSCTKCA